MKQTIIALLAAVLAFSAGPAAAADSGSGEIELRELARNAGAVALVQVGDTDYVYRRGFPVRGSAYLKVLIPYKLDGEPDMLEVYEEGLHEHECYFPDPTVFEEGRRYLVFLRRDPDDPERYRGMPQGCALDVLVDASNRYAVRIPVTGIALSDPLAALSRPLEFGDAYAHETEESLEPADRDAWLQAGWLRREGDDRYVYTHGVDLTTVRERIGPDVLRRAEAGAPD